VIAPPPSFEPLSDPAVDRAILFGCAMESAAKAECFALALGYQLAIHTAMMGRDDEAAKP
jgi:hypothetical protein